jgi:hypothetical protein
MLILTSDIRAILRLATMVVYALALIKDALPSFQSIYVI